MPEPVLCQYGQQIMFSILINMPDTNVENVDAGKNH